MSIESRTQSTEDYPKSLVVEGKQFTFVTRQRDRVSAIYKGDEVYMRIGEPERIHNDLVLHQKMESQGFPVPQFIREGKIGNKSYFFESSLGEEHLGDSFSNDMETTGSIREETFNDFLDVVEQFARAQLNTQVAPDPESFEKGIKLSVLCEELPQYAEAFRQKFKDVMENLREVPYVHSHGDFNPHNLYPRGVIDFENSFTGPFGHDLISAVTHIDHFPDSKDFEYYAGYRFSDAQMQKYLELVDRVAVETGLPAVSEHFEDFAFTRGIWSIVKMSHTPMLQKFRYDEFFKRFLSGVQ